MPIKVTRMKHEDIDGAIDTVQQAFADDPYNNWIYPDKSKVRLEYCFEPNRLHGTALNQLTTSRSLLLLGIAHH